MPAERSLRVLGRPMDAEGVREALRREPFEPFAIRLADGRSVEVKHPKSVALTSRRIIVIADGEVGSWSVIEPLLIVSLDYRSADPKAGNGPSSSRPTFSSLSTFPFRAVSSEKV